MHCSYSVLGAWCRSHACPSGFFKAHHLNPIHVPSLASVHVAGMHCLYAACTLSAHCPCASYALPCAALRCLHALVRYRCPASALPCVALHAPVRYLAHACALLVPDRRQHACLRAHASFSHCVYLLGRALKARAGCTHGMAMAPYFPTLHAPLLKSILGHFQKFLRRRQTG